MTDHIASATGTNEFADGAVPESVTSSALHLALIIIGGTIGFSVFIVAAQIGGALGYAQAALAFALGSFVLGVLATLTSYIGARSRLSTYLLTQYAFGIRGAKLANAAVAISLIGWYGVISNFLGQAGRQMLMDAFGFTAPTWVMVLIASSLMIFITIRGFKGIDKLALYLVPIMLLFLGFAAWRSFFAGTGAPVTLTSDFSFQTAVSAVVGSYISGAIIQPDYSRFAKSHSGAIWSVFVALAVIFPIVQFLSAIPSVSVGNPDLLATMAALGLSIPAFFLLALGAWSSNVLCLYSSGLSIATLTDKINLQHIIFVIGVIGTAVAFAPAQGYLVNFLVVLGVVIPPIGAIYVVDGFILRRFRYSANQIDFAWPALAAWLCGSGFGFASQSGFAQISGISSIDSLIVTVLAILAFTKAQSHLFR
ncbi:MAG: cytosine permease [Pseudomonadota bacterium]